MSTTGTNIRVLLIAEACNPEWASVPLVGYNLYRAIQEQVDVTLVTHVRNRAALLRYADASARIVFIDSEPLARPSFRLGELLTLGRGLGWTTKQALMWIPYLYFEHLVYRMFRRPLKAGQYDLVHRITPLSPIFPSPIACWSDVPFVVGPLNGGLPWPQGTTRTRLAEMELLSYARGFYRCLPYVRRTYQRAAGVIAGSRCTLAQLPRAVRRRAVYMPENGIDPVRFSANGRLRPSTIRPFRILFVGRLVPLKGVDILLEAFAASPHLRNTAELVIVGDGPRRRPLQLLAASLGIGGRVRFTGTLPQSGVADQFRNASVFAFPSIKEFGGAVVLEAMACGLPCIVLDQGGPAEFLTTETGLTLPVERRHRLVASVRQALEDLLAHPARLDSMSAACMRHVARQHTWSCKAERLYELYRAILAHWPRQIATQTPRCSGSHHAGCHRSR